MPQAAITDIVNRLISSLSARDQTFFSQVWGRKKLLYKGDNNQFDLIDEYNSKLVCVALDKRKPLFIVLPDDADHRASLMFGTALLRFAIQQMNNVSTESTILYYGTSTAFKNALSNTSINGVYLDSVFGSTFVSGNYKKTENHHSILTQLPKVICIYHPVHPEQFIQIYQPTWVAVDCGKEGEIEWFSDLISYCRKKHIPIIGWGRNNFSNIISQFQQNDGCVIYTSSKASQTSSLQPQYIVTPIVLEGAFVQELDTLFKKCKGILKVAKSDKQSRLKFDSIKATWKLLRGLEMLVIPLNIYNEEAEAFWNTYSLVQIKKSVELYISLIQPIDVELSNKLGECFELLKDIYNRLEDVEPPFWTVLSNLCLERSKEGVLRILIFPTKSSKQLFAYTLLSRFNISEEELLEDSKIVFRTINQLSNTSERDEMLFKKFESVNPIFITPPGVFSHGDFYRIIRKYNVSVMIMTHHIGLLQSILKFYNERDQLQIMTSIGSLEALSGYKSNVPISLSPNQYALSNIYSRITVLKDKYSSIKEEQMNNGISIGDLTFELAKLLEFNFEEPEPDSVIRIDINREQKESNLNATPFLITDAIEFTLEDDSLLVVNPNEQINLVKGKDVVKIYARAVQPGNVLLFIQNQVKKDLFDLLVERVNDHRSLSIHINLLQKWREEFYLSFLVWRNKSSCNNLHEFWRLLKSKGSTVETPITISNWLSGHTLRPQDELNIQRVGDVLDNSFIKEHCNEIANAASRIVGLHISLSNKLKKWLDGGGYDFKRDDMTLVDKELNLTLGELRSSMKVMRVVSKRIINDPVMASSLGILSSKN